MTWIIVLAILAALILTLSLSGPPVPATQFNEPTGYRMPDGFASRFTLALNEAINIWEVSVQPPGIDAGEAIDVSTMHNKHWHTKHAKKLLDMGECSLSCGYDPRCYQDIMNVCGLNTVITVTFPPGEPADNDPNTPPVGDQLAFYGYLRSFKPTGLKMGEFPLADVVLQPTNMDDSGAEQAPVWSSGTPGTAGPY